MFASDNTEHPPTENTAVAHKFALIVGVNNSSMPSQLASLKYAEDDAIEVYQTLRQDNCGFTFLDPVLTGSKAGTAEVRSAIIRLIDEKTDQDFLLFYFIGHAQPVKTKYGYGDIYFVTHNFNPKEVKKDANAHLSMRWLRDILHQTDGAGSVLIILDCCYAGNMIEVKPNPGFVHIDVDVRKIVEECLDGSIIKYQNGRLRVILTATGYNTSAQERIMTPLILSALQGKAKHAIDDIGNINIHSLYTHLQDQMPQEQLPNLSGEFARKCILAYYPEKSSAHLQQLQRAIEDDRWNKVSDLINKIDIITDPDYFRRLAEANLHSHVQQFDRVIEKAASIADLNQVMISGFLKNDLVQRQDDFIRGASYRDQLRQFGLLQKSHPTYGALLSFGLNPTKWLAGAFTHCTLWSRNDRHQGWLEAQDYQRDLVTQFELSRDFLRQNLRLSRIIGRDDRSQELEIPLVALGEALANALVHREYINQTSPVYVDIFKDRVEIINPGIPPEPITMEILEEEHKSHPRNPQVARIFYLHGYVEKIGSGIQRMQQAMKNAGLLPVQFELGKDKTFKAIFFRPKQVSETIISTASTNEISVDQSNVMPIWNMPYFRNPHFTGREEVLERLDQQFSKEEQDYLIPMRRAALAQPQAIKGLGGIGKTQIAIEYAYRSRDIGRYTHTFWVNAASEDTLLTGFAALAELLPAFPMKGETDQRKLVEAIKRWLEQCQQRWLLIFDNADDVGLIQQYFPQQGNGSLLLTTRANAVGSLAASIEVETMGFIEGTQLLLRRAQRFEKASDEEVNQAGNIVIALDHFPLALDQAGAYIDETQCSFVVYLDLYQKHRQALLSQRGALETDYPDSVATTWSLSFQKVKQANPAAAELLCLCAFLFPDRIPEELIRDGTPHWPLLLQQATADLFMFNQMLQELLKFSLVRRLAETQTLSIHRLIQAVQIDTMEPQMQRQWAERVIKAVDEIFPDPTDIATWPQCLRYLDQAQACNTLIEQYTLPLIEASDLLNRTGLYLAEHALYTVAEPLYQRSLSICKQQLGLEHPNTAQGLNNLATLYFEQGKYAEAEPLYQQSLRIREQSLGAEHHQVASSLTGLATLYFEQGKYTEVETLYQRALQIQEQQLGPHHLQVAYPLTGLANLYNKQGKYVEAKMLYQRALLIWEQQVRPEHPNMAHPLNGLATLYREQGQYAEAESLYQKALNIREQTLGPQHPETATSLNNLATLHWQQGQYTEAEELYQRALAILEQQLGPQHPLVAHSLHGLATLYREQGKDAQATSLFLHALAIREDALASTHIELADTLHEFAILQQTQGHADEAHSLYKRALIARTQVLGAAHPNTINTRKLLVALLLSMGNIEEATQLDVAPTGNSEDGE